MVGWSYHSIDILELANWGVCMPAPKPLIMKQRHQSMEELLSPFLTAAATASARRVERNPTLRTDVTENIEESQKCRKPTL